MSASHFRSLGDLISSIEHAEAVVNRMENNLDNIQEHKLINDTLSSHHLYLKVAAVVSAIILVGLIIGGIIVTYQLMDDEKRLALHETKIDILINRTEFMQETNKLMLENLLAVQDAHARLISTEQKK